MRWEVVARPQAEDDLIEAARWYDTHRQGLGAEFIEEVLTVFDALETNPLLHCRRHPTKNIRWRYPKRFPYRSLRSSGREASCCCCGSDSCCSSRARMAKTRL